jgi:hypothetical protein
MSDKPSVFAELKRRNVYKVAVAYAFVLWRLVRLVQAAPVAALGQLAAVFVDLSSGVSNKCLPQPANASR